MKNQTFEAIVTAIRYDESFDKIKAMIEKIIFRLMGEQKDDDEHELWCDMETEKSTESWDDKAGKKELLARKVMEADTSIKFLVKQITEQQAKVAQITDDKAMETKLLEKNHADIVATIKVLTKQTWTAHLTS